MEIPAHIRELLLKAITDKFPAEIVKEIDIEEFTIDREAGEMRIVLKVSTSVDPSDLARGYFGLTSNFRKRLVTSKSAKRHALSELFPIITPSIGHGAHA